MHSFINFSKPNPRYQKSKLTLLSRKYFVCSPRLYTITFASKNATYTSGDRIAINDTLHTGIRPRAQEEESDEDDDDVQSEHCVPVERLFMEPIHTAIDSSHSDIGNTPEDEAKERVEEG